MKITIYTVTDCQFSKQEKEYLQSHSLPFEEKNLETNREYLTEMLQVGNNFAGTPVTKIVKDDGQEVVLKGFTKEEFDKALMVAPAAPAAAPQPPAPSPMPTPPPEPVVPPAPPEAPMPPVSMPAESTPQTTPIDNSQLSSILDQLQSKTGEAAAPTAGTPPDKLPN